jgi:hypothetical protein
MRIRIFGSAILIGSGIALITSLGFGQGSLTPPAGTPAPTMKTLQEVYDKVAQVGPPVGSSSYTAYVEVSPSAGGNSCVKITTDPNRIVRLDSVSVVTYSDAASTAFLRYDVKIGAGVGRIMVLQVPLAATGTTFPVSNGRAGQRDFPVWIKGASNSEVQLGEVYAVYGCVQASAGQTPNGFVNFTGTYAN